MSELCESDFDGQYFVVLGATGGIGGALVQRIVDLGGRVFLAGRDQDKLNALSARLDMPQRRLDATDVGAVEECVQEAQKWAGGALAGVASCVGSLLLKPAHRTTVQEWDDVLATNLTSAFATVRAAGTTMRKGGAVALCSSAAAQVGLANHEAIAAAKAGVEGLVRAAAATYARRGLRCNAVAPGLVETPMTAALTANERAAAGSRALHPLERLGQPDEIARALAWLLDPSNDWVTGQVLGVDGGLAHVRPVLRA